MSEKFYWLKLKRDFFKRHDIRVIESMPNGKDYILFYLKLLCESIDHEGGLRFSDTIPYNNEMLSTITNTNVDIVKNAIEIFTKLNMMSILDDGTLYMNEVNKMIGYETEWAKKKRDYREKQKELGQCPPNVLTMSDKSKSIEKEIDIDKKEINKEKKGFAKPTLEEVEEYIKEKGYNVDPEKFFNYYESIGWKVGRNPMKNWRSCVVVWHRKNMVDERKTKAVVPSFYDDYKKGIDKSKPMTKEEEDEMNEIVKNLFNN